MVGTKSARYIGRAVSTSRNRIEGVAVQKRLLFAGCLKERAGQAMTVAAMTE